MIKKFSKALLLVLALSVISAFSVYAEEAETSTRFRAAGVVTSVDGEASSFDLHTRKGADLTIYVVESTRFRSKDGDVQSLQDLHPGMRALVLGKRLESGRLSAAQVIAAKPEDLRNWMRVSGVIVGVDLQASTFTLDPQKGEILTIQVGDRTRFRSKEGSVAGLEDLQEGQQAFVIAHKSAEGLPMALLIGVRDPGEARERFRAIGEITNVVPGQNKFDLKTKNGENLTIQVIERTRFRSRDGSIEDIHDLKKGMIAFAAGIQGEEGDLVALVVAAGELPRPPKVDVRAAGRIVAIEEQTFTLQTRRQGQMTFAVDGKTIFKSPDGSVNDFTDLEVGMVAVVGAKELGNDQLKAVWVGVRRPISQDDQTSPFRGPQSESSTES